MRDKAEQPGNPSSTQRWPAAAALHTQNVSLSFRQRYTQKHTCLHAHTQLQTLQNISDAGLLYLHFIYVSAQFELFWNNFTI